MYLSSSLLLPYSAGNSQNRKEDVVSFNYSVLSASVEQALLCQQKLDIRELKVMRFHLSINHLLLTYKHTSTFHVTKNTTGVKEADHSICLNSAGANIFKIFIKYKR